MSHQAVSLPERLHYSRLMKAFFRTSVVGAQHDFESEVCGAALRCAPDLELCTSNEKDPALLS